MPHTAEQKRAKRALAAVAEGRTLRRWTRRVPPAIAAASTASSQTAPSPMLSPPTADWRTDDETAPVGNLAPALSPISAPSATDTSPAPTTLQSLAFNIVRELQLSRTSLRALDTRGSDFSVINFFVRANVGSRDFQYVAAQIVSVHEGTLMRVRVPGGPRTIKQSHVSNTPLTDAEIGTLIGEPSEGHAFFDLQVRDLLMMVNARWRLSRRVCDASILE